MRKHFVKRLAAAAFAGILITTSLSVPAKAENDSSGQTFTGEAETIHISSGDLTARDNNFNKGWKFY